MNKQQFITVTREKRQAGESLYILLDGACEQNAVRYLFSFEGVEAYHFLYTGTPYASVMEYGPVLAAVRAPSPFLSWFWTQGPAIHAGIALFSPLLPEALAEQLRQLLTVTLPEGPKALFRFYDPRLAPAAATLAAENGSTALTKNISALYAPRYTFGQPPTWDPITIAEHTHG